MKAQVTSVEKDKITLRIYNREYTLSGEEWDPLYIAALADYVDKKMNEIANTSHIVDTSKVAVLAALNIANELFKLKESKSTPGVKINKKAEELIRLLDKAFK